MLAVDYETINVSSGIFVYAAASCRDRSLVHHSTIMIPDTVPRNKSVYILVWDNNVSHRQLVPKWCDA
jgi:hypothetical protein